jgi:hypothetical protein
MEETRAPMDVRRLVYFVLFEPPSNAAGNGIISAARVRALVQLHERIAQHRPFGWINGGDITTNAVSKRHDCTPPTD